MVSQDSNQNINCFFLVNYLLFLDVFPFQTLKSHLMSFYKQQNLDLLIDIWLYKAIHILKDTGMLYISSNDIEITEISFNISILSDYIINFKNYLASFNI